MNYSKMIEDAANSSDIATIKSLSDMGVDLSMQQEALDIAVHNGYLTIAQYLIDHMDMIDQQGYDFLSTAINANNPKMVNLLLTNGCEVMSHHVNESSFYPAIYKTLLQVYPTDTFDFDTMSLSERNH
jgi:hypothetical protein